MESILLPHLLAPLEPLLGESLEKRNGNALSKWNEGEGGGMTKAFRRLRHLSAISFSAMRNWVEAHACSFILRLLFKSEKEVPMPQFKEEKASHLAGCVFEDLAKKAFPEEKGE